MIRFISPILAACTLAACGGSVEFNVPPQKILPAGPDPPVIRPFLKMSEMDVDGFILDGVNRATPGEPSRWVNQYARLRLWPEVGRAPWTFSMRIQVAEQIRKAVGPQTITITLNGRVLDAPRFEEDRQYDYRHEVPASMLSSPVVVGLDIDPVWITGSGVRLGVLLSAVGFVQ